MRRDSGLISLSLRINVQNALLDGLNRIIGFAEEMAQCECRYLCTIICALLCGEMQSAT